MQQNTQKNNFKSSPDHLEKDTKFTGLTGSIEIHHRFSSHEKYETDFELGTGDPDNVRRQRQDYSDNWAKAHHKDSELNK